ALMAAAGAGDLFRKSLTIGTEAWAQNTALAKEAAMRYETVAAKFTVLKNRLNIVAIRVGDALVPALIEAVAAAEPLFKAISGLATKFAEMDPKTQKIIIGVTAFIAVLGPLAIAIGTVVTALSTLAPILAIITAPIVAIPIALALWITRWREIGNGVVTINRWLVDQIIGQFNRLKDSIGNIIASVKDATILKWDELSAGTVTIVNFLVEKVVAAFASVKDATILKWDELSAGTVTIVNFLVERVVAAFGRLKAAVGNIITSIKD
ncbi:unnamed protein product, partial [marine sediment metagenome]